MPGVVSMHESSETQSKPDYFRGQCWGAIGLLIGSLSNCFCCPLQLEIQQGWEAVEIRSKAAWCCPFAPRSLQTLPHYYEQLRPSIMHWYSHTHKFSYLYFSLGIMMTGSRSSHWKPSIESRPLYAGHRLHSIRNSPASLSQKIETPLVLMSNLWITTRQHRFVVTRLSIPYLLIMT